MRSARRGRVRPLSRAVLAALALVVAAGATGCLGPSGWARVPAPRHVTGVALPWPADGQAVVAMAGEGVLGSSGSMTPVPIASVTKVMTAYVLLRGHPLRDGEEGPLIEVDGTAAAESLSATESTVPVREGQRLSLRRLLELMMIPSGNNVARLLARWDAGTQEGFVRKMNAAARALGMADTVYTGASGYEDSTVSTAADQVKLAGEAMRNEVFRRIVATTRTSLPGDPRVIRNTNTLLGRNGVIGIKTGSGTRAGGSLMWAVTVGSGDGARLVLGVVLSQRVGADPEAAKQAALDASDRLITAVRAAVPRLVAAGRTGGVRGAMSTRAAAVQYNMDTSGETARRGDAR
ncbi:D-alanyl-D-alanine carboxypeptidase family protein [Microbispora sp. ATCC PTA-5024]|uniref:D-alanyl-D-alanine carboxypeptidase family protein n=1 Tax=Microbispora sp. ATCC PTA-5024 TaxID=316330 RepID=UPI0003DDB89D|nr:serine hydrolase [Microbispora sp. ATCC PTA-5024]ETK34612.1 hypothetical protein MPTA5024_18455 [Microbispora sp. ATCC PTA-5024]